MSPYFLCLLLFVPWVCLCSIIIAFPGHIYLRFQLSMYIKSKKGKIRSRYNEVSHLTLDNIWAGYKTQDNITHKRAKRLALSQQVITRLQGTNNTV